MSTEQALGKAAEKIIEKVADVAVDEIRDFAKATADVSPTITKVAEQVVALLQAVPGMTPAHERDFPRSQPAFTLNDGSTVVRTWKNPVGVDHVFLGTSDNKMVFGGFVGWIHAEGLKQALNDIRARFA